MKRPVLIGDWNYYAILRSSGLPTRSRTPSFRSSMRPFLGGIQIFLYVFHHPLLNNHEMAGRKAGNAYGVKGKGTN